MYSDCRCYALGRVRCQLSAGVLALLCLTGCATVGRQPITFDESAFDKRLETITVMPVLDVRTEKSVTFGADEASRVRKRFVKRLRALGYDVQLAPSWNMPAGVTPQQIADMSVDELGRYVPANARAALIVSVCDLRSSYSVLLTSFSITATASLVDASSRKEVWKDAVMGQYGGGGVVGATLTQIGTRSFAYDALANIIFESFPQKAGR